MKDTYLASKPRYEILDGLRGVAAFMVILFHCFETYAPVIGRQIINHGYLAVDFFFVLSGFVIGYAYDDRWDRMSYWGFFKRRLVRLHPMLVMGMVVGACLFFFADGMFPLTAQIPAWKFFLCLVMGLFLIPCPNSLDIRGWGELNSFNGPAWSLTYEYIGNILYALIFRKLPKVALAVLCVLAAFLTLNLTMGWDVFNLFSYPKYDVIGGWSLEPAQILVGFTRLLYPFLCGLLISRILPSRMSEANPSGSPLSLRGGFWWCALMLIAIFSIPQILGKSGVADGLYQAVSIIALFPVIVLIGAGSKLTDPRSAKICKFLGDISYPIYITHYPLMYLQMGWAASHQEAPLWMHIMVNAGVVILAIGLAWACLKLYDEPVRKWLTDHVLRRNRA
ncbi:MAG: acyltransferase [Bacteroidales bacterium]|nr:acyltransferase [Bacteroidales bacterium]